MLPVVTATPGPVAAPPSAALPVRAASLGSGLRLSAARSRGRKAVPAEAVMLPVGAARAPRILLQRTARHHRSGSQALLVEDMDLIWGIPKVVWIVLADIIAMCLFVVGIRMASLLAKRRPEPPREPEKEPQGSPQYVSGPLSNPNLGGQMSGGEQGFRQ
mmetsp:Transcript_51069/g.110833  ORF Transcript_51069/g.110833 Transcript_51069/m.110833 type:complete len:160 (-) Transcript_51069:39-518(-)